MLYLVAISAGWFLISILATILWGTLARFQDEVGVDSLQEGRLFAEAAHQAVTHPAIRHGSHLGAFVNLSTGQS